MRCLIVDDEYMARLLLEEYVGKIPSLELVGLCENALEAFHLLKTHPIDILFLDIQMPHLSGLEFVQTLRDKPAVIFTTAYSEYALEGFRLDAADYLLKPFSFERFAQAVGKAADVVTFRKQLFKPALSRSAELPEADHFFVKSDGKLIKVRFDDILYVEGLKEYISIYTVDKQRIITLQSIKNMESLLPGQRFVRIHKSYIIALKKIDALMGNLVEINKKLLPIGITYKDELLKKLGL